MPFMPNENSRASKLLDYVEAHLNDEGDLITYEEMLGLIDWVLPDGVPPGQALSGIVADVNTRLHRSGDWRHLQNRQGVGYYIGSPRSIREEVLGRRAAIERQMVRAIRATEKINRHPNASVAERRRATDAANAQAALLSAVRRENRRIRAAWPEDERSPVEPETGKDG